MKLRRDKEVGVVVVGGCSQGGVAGGACGDVQARHRPTEKRGWREEAQCPGGQKRRQETQSTWQPKGTCGRPCSSPRSGCLPLQPRRGPPDLCLHPNSRRGHRCRCPRPRRNWGPPSSRAPQAVMGSREGGRQGGLRAAARSHGVSGQRCRAALSLHALQTHSTQDSQRSSQTQGGTVPA